MYRLSRWLSKVSIRKKITAIILFGIGGIGILSFVVSQRTMRDMMTQQICTSNQSTVSAVTSRLDDVFSRSTAVLVGISVDESIREQVPLLYSADRAAIIGAMSKISRRLANYSYTILYTPATIAVLTEDGRFIFNGETVVQPDVEIAKTVYREYSALFAENKYRSSVKDFMPNPFYAKADSTDNYVYCTALPVYSTDSQYTALLFMLIDSRHLSSMITVGSSEIHTGVLTNGNLDIVLAQDPSLIGTNLLDIVGPKDLPRGAGYTAGRQHVVFCQPLKSYNGKFYDVMDDKYISSETQSVTVPVLLLHMVATVLLAGVARILSDNITKRITKLSEQMSVQTDFRLENAEGAAGGDEIEVLKHSFKALQISNQQLMQQNIRKEQEKREIEIRSLQSQIRPHFLFNTLNTIRCSIQNKNSDKAQHMILALSGLLRMTLIKGEELVPLAEELQTIQYYLDIMQLRSTMEFATFYQIEENLWAYRVPNLLLQPLVENCIAHGFRRKKRGGVITISAAREENSVRMLVMDNGAGLWEENADRPADKRDVTAGLFSGIGVSNVDRRIKLFFGEAYGVELYMLEGHTVAELCLPPESN